MKKPILVLLFSFISACIFAQTTTIKRAVYFDNNKYTLRPNDQATLDHLIDTLASFTILSIKLKGNTDNVADNNYNLKLSAKRTDAVKNYLLSKGVEEKEITIEALGEEIPIAENTTEEGKQKNRRVDLLISFQPLESHDTVVQQDKCKKDTTIVLPQGTQLTFNLCEYNEIKSCLEITETNNSQSILVNGQSTMDADGIPLSSCGMLKVTLKPGCTDRKCFKVPVKVRFPVPTSKDCQIFGRTPPAWILNSDKSWKQDGKKTLKIVKIKGKEFYQMNLDCPNFWINCDCKLEYKKIKFKIKKGYTLIQVKVGADCPVGLWSSINSGRKNVVKVKVPCIKGTKFVYATVLGPTGDTLRLTYRPLNDLPKRYLFAKCRKDPSNEIETKIWGIFPYKKRMLYRKYLIPIDLLEPIKK